MSTWEKEIGAITLFVEDVDRSRASIPGHLRPEPMFTEEEKAGFRLKNLYFFLPSPRRRRR